MMWLKHCVCAMHLEDKYILQFLDTFFSGLWSRCLKTQPGLCGLPLLFCPEQTGMQNLRHPVPLAAWFSRGSPPRLCVRPQPGGGGYRLLPPPRATAVVGRHQKEPSEWHPHHTGKNLPLLVRKRECDRRLCILVIGLDIIVWCPPRLSLNISFLYWLSSSHLFTKKWKTM